MAIIAFLLKHCMTQMRKHSFLQIVCTDLNCPGSNECKHIDFHRTTAVYSRALSSCTNLRQGYNANISSMCKLGILFSFNPVMNPRLQQNTKEKASSLLTNTIWT